MIDSTKTPSKLTLISSQTIDLTKKNWSQWSKVLSITKRLFQSLKVFLSNSFCLTANRERFLNHAVQGIKLTNPIGIIINAGELPHQAQAISKGVAMGDQLTATLGVFDLTMNATDIFDCTGTFLNTGLELTKKPKLTLFSSVALPIGFFLSTVGILLRGYKISEGKKISEDLKTQIASHQNTPLSPVDFKKKVALFLRKHVGVTEEEQKQLLNRLPEKGNEITEIDRQVARNKALDSLRFFKEASIKRTTSKQVFDALDRLRTLIDSKEILTKKHVVEILELLKKIDRSIDVTRRGHFANIAANLLTFAALCLLTVALSSPLPYLLLGASVAIRLAILIYDKKSQPKIPKLNRHGPFLFAQDPKYVEMRSITPSATSPFGRRVSTFS